MKKFIPYVQIGSHDLKNMVSLVGFKKPFEQNQICSILHLERRDENKIYIALVLTHLLII